jgi:hypothetical protein
VNVVHECGTNGTNSETEREDWNEPARTNPFACHVGGNFEEDVGNVEDGKHSIIVVTFETKVFFESGNLCIA